MTLENKQTNKATVLINYSPNKTHQMITEEKGAAVQC